MTAPFFDSAIWLINEQFESLSEIQDLRYLQLEASIKHLIFL